MRGEAHTRLASQFSLGVAEDVQAWICEHEERPFIALHRCQQAAPGEGPRPTPVIRMPATLLPKLTRLVPGLEEQLTAQGL
jgi:hypothetical protein